MSTELTALGLGPSPFSAPTGITSTAGVATVTCAVESPNWFYPWMIGHKLYFDNNPFVNYTVKGITDPALVQHAHADVTTFVYFSKSDRTRIILGTGAFDANVGFVRFLDTGNIYKVDENVSTTNILIDGDAVAAENASDLRHEEWLAAQDVDHVLLGGITGITQAAEAEVTTDAAHGLSVGRVVLFTGVAGMTEINGLQGEIQSVGSSTTFTVDINSTGFTAYTGPSGQTRSENSSDLFAKIEILDPGATATGESGTFKITTPGDTYNSQKSGALVNHSNERTLKCGAETDTTLKLLWTWLQFNFAHLVEWDTPTAQGAKLELTLNDATNMRAELTGSSASKSGAVISLNESVDLSAIVGVTMLSGSANATWTASNNTITLPGGTDLSNIEASTFGEMAMIRLTGATKTVERHSEWFPITSVNDGADTLAVGPTPSNTESGGADWIIWDRTCDILRIEGATGGDIPGLGDEYFTVKSVNDGGNTVTTNVTPGGTLTGNWSLNEPIGQMSLIHAETDIHMGVTTYGIGASDPPHANPDAWLTKGGDYRGFDKYHDSAWAADVFFRLDGNGTTVVIGESSNSNIGGQTAADQEADFVALIQEGFDDGDESFGFMLRSFNSAWTGLQVPFGPDVESYVEYDSSEAKASSVRPKLTVTVSNVLVDAGVATGSMAARDAKPTLQMEAGVATASAVAIDTQPIVSVSVSAGVATASAAARDAPPTVHVEPGVSAATAIAINAPPTIQVVSGVAVASGLSVDPKTSPQPEAGVAGADAVAVDVTAVSAIQADAGVATCSMVAVGTKPTLQLDAGVATATATAVDTQPSIQVESGVATASATAMGSPITIQVESGIATVLVVGVQASGASSIQVNAGVATGSMTASNATPTLQLETGVATATAVAVDARPSIQVSAGVATASVSAVDAPPSIQVAPGVSTASGTGVNATATSSVQVDASIAIGSMAAVDAAGSAPVSANAGVGTMTSASVDGSPSIQVVAGIATATSAGVDVVITIQAEAGFATATAIAVLPTAELVRGSGYEGLMGEVMPPFMASTEAEDLANVVLPNFMVGDVVETLCESLFNSMGADKDMLGEITGTLIWHFATGGTRTVTGSFQARNPTLNETSFTREERFDAVLFLPYNDTDGVSSPDRDDWLEARGELWDVLFVGSKEGGCRRIELIKTDRIHETAQQVFGRL